MSIVKVDQDRSQVCIQAVTAPTSLDLLTGELRCFMCDLTSPPRQDFEGSPDSMSAHLQQHLLAGYRVPDWVVAEVKAFATDRPYSLPPRATVQEWRQARRLCVEIGQDWPVVDPVWDYDVRARWVRYQRSYVEAVQRINRAAAIYEPFPSELCRTHGAQIRAGRCRECAAAEWSR